MMPFAPGAAALRESVGVVRQLIADDGLGLGDAAFAAVVAADLMGLVSAEPQVVECAADAAAAAAAAAVTRQLQWLAGVRLPEQALTPADAESHMQSLQVRACMRARAWGGGERLLLSGCSPLALCTKRIPWQAVEGAPHCSTFAHWLPALLLIKLKVGSLAANKTAGFMCDARHCTHAWGSSQLRERAGMMRFRANPKP